MSAGRHTAPARRPLPAAISDLPAPRTSWRAPLDPMAPVLGRIGTLETRLARSKAEIRAAQRLRYEVFYREMSARPQIGAKLSRRDKDRWDRACDHLLVIERGDATGRAAPGKARGPGQDDSTARIVGTYRFLTAENAERAGTGFYSRSEFDIDALLRRHAGLHFMELGRSCVLANWRNRRTIELLWAGTWSYVLDRGIDVMIGCASFAGTDPDRLAEPLSFLHRHAAAPPEWNVPARSGRGIALDRLAPGKLDRKRALQALPPLIKGYLRLGAWVGHEAVIDAQFGTTDVLIVLPVARINPRYINYYGADAGRHAGPTRDEG